MDEKTVKKILGIIIKADEQDWEWERMGKELDAALYSEPQVCPKPEQMMICPECGGKKVTQSHLKDYVIPCWKCNGTGKVPQSLPVPSTPAKKKQLGENNG